LKAGQQVAVSKSDGTVKKAKVMKVNRFEGLGRREVSEIRAGDLCAIEGIPDIEIGDTLMDIENQMPMARVKVDEPTLQRPGRLMCSRSMRSGPFRRAWGWDVRRTGWS